MTMAASPHETLEQSQSLLGNHDGPNMFVLRRFGVFMTFFCFGLTSGAGASLVYPLFTILRDDPSNYQRAVSAAFKLFLSLKVFFGLWSDSFPIRGQRRKPYILLGWCIAIGASLLLAVVASLSSTTTVCRDDSEARVACDDENATTKIEVQNVPEGFLIAMFMTNNFGAVMAEVASESLVVELAKKEPYERRGQLQGYCFMMMYLGSICAALLTGFGLNGPLYHGSFSFELGISTYLWLICGLQAIGLPFWLALEDAAISPEETVSLRQRLLMVKGIIRNKAYSQMLVFNVIMNACGGTTVAARNSVLASWVEMSPLAYSFDTIVQRMALALTMYACGRHLKDFDWHRLYIVGEIIYLFLMCLFWLVVFDIVRQAWLVIFIDADQQAAAYSGWLIVSWAAVEMAPAGLEGTTLALATTVGNAGFAFGGYLTRLYNGFFALSRDDLRRDDAFVRNQYVLNALLVMLTQLGFFPFLCWVPRQKDDAQRRFNRFETSACFSALALGLAIFVVFWDTGSTIAGLVCSCAQWLGGPGCKEGYCTKG